jgi:hypothetical protein
MAEPFYISIQQARNALKPQVRNDKFFFRKNLVPQMQPSGDQVPSSNQ